jgi:hypothetical protein
MKETILIDTNLLLLLVVGTYDRDLIAKHKKTDTFDVDDYELLLMRIENANLLVTPNIVTETSNLVSLIGDPHMTALREVLGELVLLMSEVYVKSSDSCVTPAFPKLGITDAGILELKAAAGIILTTDLDLHLAALDLGIKTENFIHLTYS